MIITFHIQYHTALGQHLAMDITAYKADRIVKSWHTELFSQDHHLWQTQIHIDTAAIDTIVYNYSVEERGQILRHEPQNVRLLQLDSALPFLNIKDEWADYVLPEHLQSSAFSKCIYKGDKDSQASHELKPLSEHHIYFRLNALPPTKGFQYALVGSCPSLGKWDIAQAIPLHRIDTYIWQVELPMSTQFVQAEYKYVLQNVRTKEEVEWELGDNRVVVLGHYNEMQNNAALLCQDGLFRQFLPTWRGAGLVLPLFSLRTESTFGVGDMTALCQVIQWCAEASMQALQLLPINDTTSFGNWRDSYPYNSISVFALHPMYLDILAMGEIDDPQMMQRYTLWQQRLNDLTEVDYERVNAEKSVFIKWQYDKYGDKVIKSEQFLSFCQTQKEWLPQYAAFCYFRDKYQTPDFRSWEEFAIYDEDKLTAYFTSNEEARRQLYLYYYIQYELHKQLTKAKETAQSLGVILKGDIPIGICRNSDSAWTSPHLFNFGGQAGAPPDDFATDGQNWGFPTYSWAEHKNTNYQWWKARLTQMEQYFDAYRVDHVLGFFRIWEIPYGTYSGLLGQFSPARGLSIKDMEKWGFSFDEDMLNPRFSETDLEIALKEHTQWFVKTFMTRAENGFYYIGQDYVCQDDMRKVLQQNTALADNVKKAAEQLFTNVLFIKDKSNPNLYHPRIVAYKTAQYKALGDKQRESFDALYHHYYYERNDALWISEALQKLKAITQSSTMLACAEDLGMLPNGVRETLEQVDMLTLEIQTMPKQAWTRFADTTHYPYMSVATISTHDMPPLRNWWNENPELAALYYKDVLRQADDCPSEATTDICQAIVMAHLNSPSMLCLLSFQDWVSINEEVRQKDYGQEQINHPDNPNQYWRYRMHTTVEALMANTKFNRQIRQLIQTAQRS